MSVGLWFAPDEFTLIAVAGGGFVKAVKALSWQHVW